MENINNNKLLIFKRMLLFDDKYLKLEDGSDIKKYMRKALWFSLPSLLIAMNFLGLRVLLIVITAFISGAVIEIIFGKVRKKPIGGGLLVFAILLALILPPGIPLWMVALGSAFGILFGKEVFGGTGHHIFHPVLISKGFLVFSYPSIVKGNYFGSMLGFSETNPNIWIVCSFFILLGAIAMIIARRSNLLIILSILAAGIGLGQIMITKNILAFDSVLKFIASDGLLFGICFLACDPCGSPKNNIGKIIYGLLIGSVAVFIRSYSSNPEAMLTAILLGNLFAPVIDAVADLKKEEKGTP